MHKRATGYVVLPYGAYSDNPKQYVKCANRDEVAAQLTDFGWVDNPGVYVYVVTKGETFDSVIANLANLAEYGDPYPDYVVEYGPRGGIQWNRA